MAIAGFRDIQRDICLTIILKNQLSGKSINCLMHFQVYRITVDSSGQNWYQIKSKKKKNNSVNCTIGRIKKKETTKNVMYVLRTSF